MKIWSNSLLNFRIYDQLADTMEGFVNHYIEEPQENYTILRGSEDIYQFQLKPTKVRLHDPTTDGGTLSFEEKGLTFGTFPTKVCEHT